MGAKKVTVGETEADIEVRISQALNLVFPWLAPNSLKHQLTWKFVLGHKQHPVDGGTVSLAQGRLDILITQDDRPIAILELKRPNLSLTEADVEQGLSYARVMHPQPPLVVVTNGKDVELYETHSGDIWKPEVKNEQTIKQLFNAAGHASSADLNKAVETLLGPDSTLWINAIREATSATISDMTGDWNDPTAIFVDGFHIPRTVESEITKNLMDEPRVIFIEGPPLVGKTHVLKQLADVAEPHEDFVVLLVEAGGGAATGIIRAITDLLSSALGWGVKEGDVRRWLKRHSHGEGPVLVLAVDGLSLEHATVQQELAQLSSNSFGDRLKLLIEADESLMENLWYSKGRHKLTPLARRSIRIDVGPLSNDEFDDARNQFATNGMYFFDGAENAEEYRLPWVLRAMGNDVVGAPEQKSGLIAMLPPMLSLELIHRVREKFDNPHLNNLAERIAQVAMLEYESGNRSSELVLRGIHNFIIRRAFFRTHIEHSEFKEMLDCNLVKVIVDENGGQLIVGRLPELIASELSRILADRLSDHMDQNAHSETVNWFAGITSNLPMGDVIGAFAMIDTLSLRKGLPFEFISNMLQQAPEIQKLKSGTKMVTMFPGIGEIELEVGENGRVTFGRNGHKEFHIEDESINSTYGNLQSWQILSHLGGYPIEVPVNDDSHPNPRLDPAILATVGTSRVLLRRPQEDPSKTGMLVHDLEEGGETACDHAGFIEPITFSIFKFLKRDADTKHLDDWLMECCDERDQSLLSRLALALRYVALGKDSKLTKWATTWRNDHVLPALKLSRDLNSKTEVSNEDG